MKVLIEYWEAAVKLHTSAPSTFSVLLVGLTFAVLAFVVENPVTSTIYALFAMYVMYLYVDVIRLEVHIQRDLLQKFINSLDD